MAELVALESVERSSPVSTVFEVNRQQFCLLFKLQQRGVDLSYAADFLEQNPDRTLYGLILSMDQLLRSSDLIGTSGKTAPELRATLTRTQYANEVFEVCFRRLDTTRSAGDKTIIKKHAQRQILESESLTIDEQKAFLAVMEQYSRGITGLEPEDLQALLAIEAVLGEEEPKEEMLSQPLAVVHSLRKARLKRRHIPSSSPSAPATLLPFTPRPHLD